jgi:predicted RNase H-like HicB family nuclease
MANRTASTTREVPVVKSYVFLAELLQEEDGRWSAGVPSLPGCATWGHTRVEALRNLRDAVEAYVRDVHEAGGEIPKDAPAQVRDEPLVAVTV